MKTRREFVTAAVVGALGTAELRSHAEKTATVTVGPARRIVTDAGAGGYQAFPDICRLKTGELMCVFYAGYTHISHPKAGLPKGGRVAAIKSADEGLTWSAPFTVVDTEMDDRDPSICCLPDGRLLINFFQYGLYGECDTCISQSVDNGVTWSEPEVIVPSFATSSPIRRLRSGRLLLPVYTVDGGGKRSFPGISISDNQGKSWSAPHPIGEHAGKVLDETDLFERKDGTVLAVMREIMCGAESKDGGKSWGAVYNLGFPGHCPYLLQTRSGVLIMAHRLPGTSLHYSLDEGRTWIGPVAIDRHIGAYPSMVELKNGRVLVVFYEEGGGSAISSAEITVTVSGSKK
jgi:hypothetical protein